MIARDALARRVGILEGYHSIDGAYHACSPDTAVALLSAMGLEAQDEGAAARSLATLEAEEQSGALPGLLVVEAGQPSDHDLGPWTLRLEDGGNVTADPEAPWKVPALPGGVHELHHEGGIILVIAAPPRAPVASDTGSERPVWGVTAALYGLRSHRNLGLGDYEDLARTAEALGVHGADFLGINPVHARGIAEGAISPYSPSSRTAFDTGHIAVDRLAECIGCPSPELGPDDLTAVSAAQEATLVDYNTARDVQRRQLRALFAAFTDTSGNAKAAFEGWQSKRGETDQMQAVFEAISVEHGPDWRRWPDVLRDPSSAPVQAFGRENAAEVDFHAWCQWAAERQIADAQERAVGAGMAHGLYLDIAVGVRPGGAETWANRSAFSTGASLGAPPDLLNTEGQNWDLAPFSPLGLRKQRFRPFREMLRRTMRHAGVVRIDHIIGFARSYWAPADGTPGGYVVFPLEALLALTRLEAQRAGCLVVGEDLGTVPDGLRDSLDRSGLYGCAILPFEREWIRIRHPREYRPMTLAGFGTHDLPSIEGWWQGGEIATRQRLGHPVNLTDWEDRARDRVALCHLLAADGLLPDGIDPDNPPVPAGPDLRDAIHALLMRGASGLVAVSLDDILGVADQQNVPGTINEEPNWRRRVPVQVEDLGTNPGLARTARRMVP